MQYPQMKTNPSTVLSIPSFGGGINSSAPVQDIQDNQAAAISNMWLKDGVLQTRPALTKGVENAYFKAQSKLTDLGVEIKLGFENYNSDDTAKGNAVQHTYRLMLSDDKQFLLYDVISNSFSNIEIEFQKELYQACFNEGVANDAFFYTNGLGSAQPETEDGYVQVFYTEIYGYIKFTKCVSLGSAFDEQSIKMLFYLEPYVSDGTVKLKVMAYNSVKDLPSQHTPYSPTVTLDYGESYGGTLEDFNLMSNASIAKYNINKSLDEMGELTNKTEFANKGFAGGQQRFGNFNSWEKTSFTLPGFNSSFISEAILFGEFKFYSYQVREWDSVLDFVPSDGELVSGVYADTKNQQYDETAEPVTNYEATATKLIIKFNAKYQTAECVFYDKYDNIVDPSSFKYNCCGKAEANFTADQLDIWFPSTSCKFFIPHRYESLDDGDLFKYRWTIQEKTFHTADIYIDQMSVYYYQQGDKGDVEFWDEQNRSDLVTKNKHKIWYGGTNSGYMGGTRLFVAGHPEFKNVVRWSNVNDSSYFLENNFSYVGRDDEEITALNKQDGYLVVFKERELYALEYTYTTDAQDKALVYFPITPISPQIGCDCPDTIQLVANRLTWLSSEGKVYTLYSANSYSERNVRELSQHIENDLRTFSKEELQNAKSVDYDNNYIIFIGKTAFIWNYDVNPFYNYTSSEQAQKRLAWFKWEFPYDVEYTYNVNGQLVVICGDGYGGYQGYMLDYAADYDEMIGDVGGSFIYSGIKSKLFDFGKPFTFKRISKAFLEVVAEHQGDLKVRFYTDNGVDDHPVTLSTIHNTADFWTYSLRPYLRRVRGAGFEIVSKTPFKLLSASIIAEIYGEVK